MGQQGVRLSDEQIEIIKTAWMMTRNGTTAGRMAGCSAQTANKYIREHSEELLQHLRENGPTMAARMEYALDLLIGGLMDPNKIKGARMSEVATAVGILTDKIQLLRGEATTRTEIKSFDPSVLTIEEREMAARIRDKIEAGDMAG